MSQIKSLILSTNRNEPGALLSLLRLPKVREVCRVRASKAAGYPFERTAERYRDAIRCCWEVASGFDDAKAAKLATDSTTLAYLAGGIRNRLHKQVRADLNLREVVVTDDLGRRRYMLQPKFEREPWDVALRQIDRTQDPLRVITAKESVLEVQRALATAPMPARARQVLTWRMAGIPGAEMKRRLGRRAPQLYPMLKAARAAVRDQLYAVRTGAIQ